MKSTKQDHLLHKAIDHVTIHRIASASFLQRRLAIGYQRAADLISVLESSGVIGPADENFQRPVYMPPLPSVSTWDKIIVARVQETPNYQESGKCDTCARKTKRKIGTKPKEQKCGHCDFENKFGETECDNCGSEL